MLEVADIFGEAAEVYRDKYATRMLPSHLRAMRDIEDCRTEAMGGHVKKCDTCEAPVEYTYHSCRNRHCPKCHGQQTQRWLDTQRGRLLPCAYYLLTFTLPSELRRLARRNQKLVYSILMRAAAQSLIKLTADPHFVGARPGIMAVLHTWTRAMLYHPHVHLLVTAGGLSDDGQRWLEPKRPRFLVPGRALSVIFRAKVRDALAKARLLEQVAPSAWTRPWVVHCKHAGSGHKVLDYLARYVFRIAIANERLESFDGGRVTFRYRDSKTGKTRRCTLPAEEFIFRFLQHVLPRGFTKVRYYGLLSSASKHRLEAAKALVYTEPSDDDRRPCPEAALKTASADAETADRCPQCHVGRMRRIASLPRRRGPP